MVGVMGLILELGLIAVAAALGHSPDGNYKGPSLGENATVVQALTVVFGAGVLAPVTEEVIFRGTIEGGMRAGLSRFVNSEAARFWIPAVISSLIFVSAHETADPVL
ncbi:MAG: hypothetical protein FD126_3786, partial [Elusimicrobia bacterium]